MVRRSKVTRLRSLPLLALTLSVATSFVATSARAQEGTHEEEMPLAHDEPEEGDGEPDANAGTGTSTEGETNEGSATGGGTSEGGTTEGGTDTPEPLPEPTPTPPDTPDDGTATDGPQGGEGEPSDAADDPDVELDEWGLPIEDEEEEPRAPPPPYGVRLGYEILGTFVGALSMSAIGFGMGAATAGITTAERTTEDILNGAGLGTAIALPFGAALGVFLAGRETGGTGTPGGAILGALAGAAVGVGVGLGVGYGADSFEAGSISGSITGVVLSLVGAVVGYELTSGPHPEPEEEAGDSARFYPLLAPTDGGALLGLAGTL